MNTLDFSIKKAILYCVALFIFSSSYCLELPLIFSDNMVIQQNDSLHIWGWGSSWRSKVVVSASWGITDTVAINSEGKWDAYIKTPPASFDTHSIRIAELSMQWKDGKVTSLITDNITIQNVLVGEVWLCSGQSNMDMDSKNIIGSKEEIEKAIHPAIRFFKIKKRTADFPQENFAGGQWTECTPETMQSFSAVGYFFGLDLKEKLDVPVGLIADAWGGIAIDAAYSQEAVKDSLILKESGCKQEGYWDGAPHKLGILYNGMTFPMRDYAIAGMLWYQGEGNVGVDPDLYCRKQSVLVHERRKQFGEDLPFYYVQIAPYKYNNNQSAIIRDQQRMASEIKNSKMVIISDVGDTLDIHPRQKKVVGQRLANVALKHHYQVIDQLVDPPLFKKAYLLKNYVYIEFINSDGLYFEKGDLGYFEVAGADGEFRSVPAKIIDNKVRLAIKKIDNPDKVRFAFSDTATPLLKNKAGLPASCFSAQFITQ